MAEVYCQDCEVEIKLPSAFTNFIGSQEPTPIKFKDGYRCADCARKKQNRGKK